MKTQEKKTSNLIGDETMKTNCEICGKEIEHTEAVFVEHHGQLLSCIDCAKWNESEGNESEGRQSGEIPEGISIFEGESIRVGDTVFHDGMTVVVIQPGAVQSRCEVMTPNHKKGEWVVVDNKEIWSK